VTTREERKRQKALALADEQLRICWRERQRLRSLEAQFSSHPLDVSTALFNYWLDERLKARPCDHTYHD
jgi:hypothetical protein